ncbi:MAG: lytic transglycosylase domain-containing protein [Pseudomonadota bacterium]
MVGRAFTRIGAALVCMFGVTGLQNAGAADAPSTAAQAEAPLETPFAPADPLHFLKPLSADDTALYQEIFAVQETGKWKTADALIKRLENDVLMGYVKYQRYMHPTAYRSRYNELKNWMGRYADHPDAYKIYKLAVSRRPKGAGYPKRAERRKWRPTERTERHPDLEKAYKTSSSRLRRVRNAEAYVRRLLRKNRPTAALNYIDSPKVRRHLADVQYDRIRSWIAASYFFNNVDPKAYRVAVDVADRNGEAVPYAAWVAGLTAWRQGDIAAAARYFELQTQSDYQNGWMKAAGGFWAARAHLAASAPHKVAPALEIAAEHPFTFYGQLALAQLGRDFDYQWAAPNLNEAEFKTLAKLQPRVMRAAALVQVGRIDRADEEMRRAYGALEPKHDEALLAVASGLNLPAAQIDIALGHDEAAFHGGLYPIPDYAPENGFKVDRALIYAFMRQESKFKPNATSRVGARGLMQVMPRTASYIAKDRTLHYRSNRNKLYNPAFNLKLGQKYVQYLLDEGGADGDLFKLTIAYNGGPGNLRRWTAKMPVKDDPLLFIESIPNTESRDFVERVATNLWVYRARLGQPSPSRDLAAAGAWPTFTSLKEDKAQKTALHDVSAP